MATATTKEPGPGCIVTAGQARRQGMTLQTYLSVLSWELEATPLAPVSLQVRMMIDLNSNSPLQYAKRLP